MRKKGFSIVELVVIIAVMGLLFGIAVPPTVQVFRRAVDQKVNEVVSDLKDLREIAIASSANITIQKTADNKLTVTIDYPDPNTPDVQREYTYDKIVFKPAYGLSTPVPDIGGTIDSDGFTFPNNTITFLRYGSPTNSGAIYITDAKKGKQIYAISITLAGRIKLWKWVGGGWK